MDVKRSYGNEIIIITGFLTAFGLLAVYSSSGIPALQKTGDAFLFVKKQALVSLLGFGLLAALQFIPFKWIERATLPLLALSMLLISLTLIPQLEHRVNGAARWLKLGPATFQPAELAKLALVLFMAKNLARQSVHLKSLKNVFTHLVIPCLLAIPLMMQPDFGSTFLILLLSGFMLFIAGLKGRHLLLLLSLGLFAVIIAIVRAPYRFARLTSFLEPWENLHSGGFQIIQSYLGFQNGGFFGLGIGESRQKLYFLPEAHTDFILAVIGEEYGLFGVLFIILCFAMLLNSGIKVALRQKRTYRRFMAFGLTSLIAMQACINMGVAMGLLPTKGISLPFVSSGASSLLVFLMMAGLLSRLDRKEI